MVFSSLCIVHRHLHLYQQNKSCGSKVKFRWASNCCKLVFETAKLALIKQKSPSLPKKLGSWDFQQIANSVLSNSKSAKPPQFNRPEFLSSAFDKAKLFAKTFLRTLILMTQISLYLFLSRTNLKLRNISKSS